MPFAHLMGPLNASLNSVAWKGIASGVVLIVLWSVAAARAASDGDPTPQAAEPAWARNLPLYQAYPHEGWSSAYVPGSYFRRTNALLPALKEMGVGIIWMIPVHPRGPAPGAAPPPHISKNAQFSSSSPYCVRDYYAVDPNWGTPDELKSMIRHAHTLGLRVMMDMVINHTSWGNPLLVQHPGMVQKRC